MNNTTEQSKILSLTCCCCGAGTIGRQWRGRDKGFGLCPNCATWITGRGESAEEMHANYGEPGVHYNLSELED